jgi:hypothetical protein
MRHKDSKPKPKLHVIGRAEDDRPPTPPGHEGHEHSWVAPEVAEVFCDQLADTDFVELLYRSGIFDRDDDQDPEIGVHRCSSDQNGYARAYIGSPHGGPVFVVMVGLLTAAAADDMRSSLAGDDDEQHPG